jgi:hypothetical protein
VGTGDYSEPGWHLSSPGRKRIREDFTGGKTTAVILTMVRPLEITVLRILIFEGVAALNAT